MIAAKAHRAVFTAFILIFSHSFVIYSKVKQSGQKNSLPALRNLAGRLYEGYPSILNVGVRVGVAEGCGTGVLVAGGRGVVGTGEYCGSVGVRVGDGRSVGVSVGLISTVGVGVRVRVGV